MRTSDSLDLSQSLYLEKFTMYVCVKDAKYEVINT